MWSWRPRWVTGAKPLGREVRRLHPPEADDILVNGCKFLFEISLQFLEEMVVQFAMAANHGYVYIMPVFASLSVFFNYTKGGLRQRKLLVYCYKQELVIKSYGTNEY
jgi:hypothetical protein